MFTYVLLFMSQIVEMFPVFQNSTSISTGIIFESLNSFSVIKNTTMPNLNNSFVFSTKKIGETFKAFNFKKGDVIIFPTKGTPNPSTLKINIDKTCFVQNITSVDLTTSQNTNVKHKYLFPTKLYKSIPVQGTKLNNFVYVEYSTSTSKISKFSPTVQIKFEKVFQFQTENSLIDLEDERALPMNVFEDFSFNQSHV